MAMVGVNGYRASGKCPDGFWSGIPRVNVCWACGIIENHVVASRLAGMDPIQISWVYLVAQKRHATLAEVQALCSKAT